MSYRKEMMFAVFTADASRKRASSYGFVSERSAQAEAERMNKKAKRLGLAVRYVARPDGR